MKVILLRHAKSSWQDPLQEDHARGLNKRGRASAEVIGNWLRAQNHIPTRVLCSNAVRTRETLALLDFPAADVAFRENLYLASEAVMLRALEACAPDQTTLLVGHNPGMGELALDLAEAGPLDPDIARFPTAACLVLEFDGGVIPHTGRVLDFATPRNLLG